MLMLLKQAHELFTKEFEETAVGLSKFCSLRPFQVKLFEQIPTMFVSANIMKTSA